MGQCKSGVVLIATCYLNKFKKKKNYENFVSLVFLKLNIN